MLNKMAIVFMVCIVHTVYIGERQVATVVNIYNLPKVKCKFSKI